MRGGISMIEITNVERPKIKVALDDGAYMPERAHAFDAGMDLKTPIGAYVCGRDSTVIDTGVHVQIPEGYVGMLKSKSGLNVKDGITSEGVIDAGYTGSIKVKLYNHNQNTKEFSRGDKITQLVIVPCMLCDVQEVKIDEIEGGERGDNGFGSTGK
jgi:dUTP pyrophosphatase